MSDSVSLSALARINARLESALGPIVATLCGALALTVLWQVATRLTARVALALDVPTPIEPSRWTEELASFLLAWTALLGAAYALRRGEHIGLDLVYVRFGAAGRARIDRIARAAVVAFGALIAAGGAWLTWLTWVLEQRTPALGWPMGLVYAVLPLAGLLMAAFAAERAYVDTTEAAP